MVLKEEITVYLFILAGMHQAASALTVAQIAQYRSDGYVVVDALFTPPELARANAAISDITREALASADHRAILELEPAVEGQLRVPRRIYDPFQYGAFRAMATSPCLLDRIQSLIGPDFNLHHSKLNMKPARIGSPVEWHQDLTYFPHTNTDLVTALVYLDDADEHNGCLQVLPRHQHHYFDHNNDDGSFAGMIRESLSDGRFGRPVSLAAKAGSVIFMHCLTPHASMPNRSASPRRTLIFEYRAADSFPIYYGEQAAIAEAKTCHLCGKRATHARFSGPQPLIPWLAPNKSIYEVQLEAKKIGQNAAI